jgi:mono/diheme cytochrome c family protein
MTNKSARPSPIAPLGGVVVGIAVFLGVNITSGWAIIPTADSVKNHGRSPLPQPAYRASNTKVVAGPVGPYQSVCATCHQAEGQGMPGAFPPLAGSEWLTGNPEVPIRIVLAGLTGAIEVKGATFNAMMPPPPMSDEQIAEAITYARTHFGNAASNVDVALVKQVRASLAGRTTPFTADELKPLLAAGGAAAPAAGEAAPAAADAAGAPAAAPAAAGVPAAAPVGGASAAAPAAPADAPAGAPTAAPSAP